MLRVVVVVVASVLVVVARMVPVVHLGSWRAAVILTRAILAILVVNELGVQFGALVRILRLTYGLLDVVILRVVAILVGFFRKMG